MQKLHQRIREIHFGCHRLVKMALEKYLPVVGNVGVFCQTDEEYEGFLKLSQQLTKLSDNPKQKYFELEEPMVILAERDVPEAEYTHLYIRKPDPTPFGQYLGDIDFVMERDEYIDFKRSVKAGKVKGAEIYDRPGWDAVMITNPNINSAAFVMTKPSTEKVRVMF